MAHEQLAEIEVKLHETEQQMQNLLNERNQLQNLLQEKEELLKSVQTELEQLKSNPIIPHAKEAEAPENISEEKRREANEDLNRQLELDAGQDQTNFNSTPKKPWIPKLLNRVGSILGSQSPPIGVDMEDDSLTFIQVQRNADVLEVVQAMKVSGPENVDINNPCWGMWAVETMRNMTRDNEFKGRKIALAVPVRETYIDHLTIHEADDRICEHKIFTMMKSKLPFRATPENTIIKYTRPTKDQVVAFALERQRVDVYIAMCEKAKLEARLLSVWPEAMVNTCNVLHTPPRDRFVMLLDMAMSFTNIVVFSNATLYYARTIPIGVQDLEQMNLLNLLAGQILNSRNQFFDLYKHQTIDKTIYFANQVADRKTIEKVAKLVAIPSQLADPFAVLKISPQCGSFENKDNECHLGWSVALGLSLNGCA